MVPVEERRLTDSVDAVIETAVFGDVSRFVRGEGAPVDSNDIRIPLPKAIPWPVFADQNCD